MIFMSRAGPTHVIDEWEESFPSRIVPAGANQVIHMEQAGPRGGEDTSPAWLDLPGSHEGDVSAEAAAHPISKGFESVQDDPVRAYLHEIQHHPLLSASEETDLGRAMEGGRRAAEELEGSMELPWNRRISLETAVRRGQAARSRMVESNLRLVVANARRCLNRGLLLGDLIQEGNIGLIRATEKYDYRRGFRFSTYATWWIRQAMGRAAAGGGRVIRLPVHIHEAQCKVNRATMDLCGELGRQPLVEEIADRMRLTPARVNEILAACKETSSLETPVGDDETQSLGDLIEDASAESPQDVTARVALRTTVSHVLDGLTARERRVIELRFGLEDDRPRTLEQTGQEFGLTRERVRQIEAEALQKLRRPAVTLRLKDFLD